jgi:hypothetical protein
LFLYNLVEAIAVVNDAHPLTSSMSVNIQLIKLLGINTLDSNGRISCKLYIASLRDEMISRALSHM